MVAPHNSPAGWYPQADGTQRYWDGRQWTEHIAPAPEPAPTTAMPVHTMDHGMAPPPGEPGTEKGRSWYKRKRFIIPAAALALIIGVAVIGGGDGAPDPEPATSPSATEKASPEPTESVTEEAAAEPEVEASDEPETTPEPESQNDENHTASQTQAIRSAESYLDFTSFSRSSLIDQLVFEGFTQERAAHGADSVGL